MSEISDLLKLPVKYDSAYFAIKDTDNRAMLIVNTAPFPAPSVLLKVGDFIATAINSYSANRVRIEELEKEKAELVEALKKTANYIKEIMPKNVFVGDGGKDEKLYLAYHTAKQAIEKVEK